MARLMCTWCFLWVAAVGVTPPSIVPPSVPHAAVSTGTVVSQVPGVNVGNSVANVANPFSNTQVTPGLRGQPSIVPTDTESLGGMLRSTTPTDAAIREAQSVRQQFSQELLHAPAAASVESGNSLGALVLAVVAGAVAGGLWWRRRAQALQRKGSTTDMTSSSSIVWSEQPTFAVAAVASEGFDPIGLATDGGRDAKIKHGRHVLLEALPRSTGFGAVLNASACRARMLRRAGEIDAAGVGATLTSAPAFGTTSRRASEQQGRGQAVARAALGDRRVVVTGMGITSCLGNSLDEVADSLASAKSGITYSEEYAKYGIKSQVRGVPTLSEADLKELIPRKALRFMGRNAQYAYVSLDAAIKDANLKEEDYQENPRCASILGQGGTSISDVTESVAAVADQVKRWPSKVGPYRVTRTMGSTVSAVLSSAFKLQGPSFSISSACSTGAHCIGVGMEQIQLDKVDMAMVGAGENECWEFTAMFDCMGALSTKRNDTPTEASRAFDKDRDGFVIAGGGGMLVLEELEHAKARGAKIYAELVGYAANSDGYDVVAPSGVGGERCMKLAMAMADKIGGEKQVDYVNTHGTSTPVGDVQELGAVKRVFSEKGYMPFVGSTKSLSGHALGAAGVHEAIYSLLMADRGFLAQSANIENLVDEADGMKILTEKHEGPVNRVLSNSFGFGGTNACLVFDRWTGD